MTGGALGDDDLGGDALLEEADVGDDADGLVTLAEGFQGGQGDFKGLGVQRAKAFVDEQGVDVDRAAGEVGKAERQG